MKNNDINEHLPSDHLRRRKDDQKLLERLEFEQLISALSTRFVKISPDKMDEEIERSLKQIYEFFGCDRSALLEGTPDKTQWKITHVAARENLPPVPVGEKIPAAASPWIFEKLTQKHEIVAISNLDDLPAEADADRQVLMQWGIRSNLSVPIIIDGSIDHVININAVNNACAWPEELVSRVQFIGEMIVNAVERNKNRMQMDEQLRFESLLSNLSSEFVNISSDEVDNTIRKWLRTLVEFFRVDRCTIGLFSNVLNRLTTTFNYHAPGSDRPPETGTKEQLPWYFGQLMAGKNVIINHVEDLPLDAQAERRLCLNSNMKSLLAVPLGIGGKTLGTCVFVSSHAERVWPEILIPRLRLVGEIFANALLRKQTDAALREREARISLIAEAVGAGLWIIEADTQKVWASAKSREIFQFAPDEDIAYQSYFRVIHPEDKERVYKEVAHALQSGESLHCDFRIVLSDGAIRWIVARGQRYLKSTGEPERLMGMSLDITDRKLMEMRLSESQTLLNSLINSTPDLIWSVDAERFGLLTFNNGLSEYFLQGVGLHIRTGMTPEDLLPPEFAGQWHALYRRALEEGSFTTDYQSYAEARILRLSINTLKRDDSVFGLSVFAQDITERKRMENQLQEQLAEIKKLKTRLEEENVYLRNEIKMELGIGTMIGESAAIKYILFRAQQVASTNATVLILGDTGTGKGMVAHAIHEMSERKDKSMVTINCAALPENLIESELFGREKGAFTGAHARQIGRFEVANGGTLFMDEIGEMPFALQTKLLRVLQDGEFERLGGTKTIKVDVRVIAATSRDLKTDVDNGRFRQDLYYRLNVFPLSVPPLSMRTEDIPLLVNHFIGKYSQKYGRQIETVSRSTLQKLQSYPWPGNVRELEHVIERAVIISPGPELNILDALESKAADKETAALKDLETTEREHILKVLQKTKWKIDGEGGAAAILGLNPSTLRFRIKKLGITRPWS